jgi:hypothetical protein
MVDHRKQWREYRSLRNLTLAVAVLIIALALVGVVFEKFISIGSAWLIGLIAIGSGLFSATIVTAIKVENWKCPRCGKRFVSKWSSKWMIFFTERCANCGLAKFADS